MNTYIFMMNLKLSSFELKLLYLSNEVGKFREYTTIGCQVFYGIGECVMVGIAYLVPNWRHMTLYFLAIPMLALNLAIFLIYESPK